MNIVREVIFSPAPYSIRRLSVAAGMLLDVDI
jgi:hypothetical protein